MNYTIQEILPGQIRVEFEDGSWAMVPIHPQATADEVDNAVSKYDKDFLPDPDTLRNPNIIVGEQRTSVAISELEVYEKAKIGISTILDGSSEIKFEDNETNATSIPNKLDFGVANPMEVLVLSQYYSERGDTRLKDALQIKIEKFISDQRYNFNELINNLLFDADDIVEQAEAELNGQ